MTDRLAVARDALDDVLAALVAAHSLLSRSPKKAAASDKMFDTMLGDYQRSIDRAREALAALASPPDTAGGVAYRYRWKIDGEYVNWRYSDVSNHHQSLDGFEQVTLYAAPPDTQAEIDRLRAENERLKSRCVKLTSDCHNYAKTMEAIAAVDAAQAKGGGVTDDQLKALCQVASMNWVLSGDQVYRLYQQVLGLISKHAEKPSERTDSARPVPDAVVERLAEFLCSEFDFDLNPCVGYSWPEHPDDDGYRGGGYVKLQPSDVQARARENAKRILSFVAALTQSEPTDRARPVSDEDVEAAARAMFDAEYPVAVASRSKDPPPEIYFRLARAALEAAEARRAGRWQLGRIR